jgi:light-regulated signal transduction histidine kinase (bacteriophytochrome)
MQRCLPGTIQFFSHSLFPPSSRVKNTQAAHKQLKVNMTPTDIMHDVLESVKAMLPQRDTKFEVQIECPDGLAVMTDRLRLKQIVFNLARNSVKFIDRGYIRLRADVVDDEVFVYVEDSGPGIPKEKREILFNKFQESLDSLSQGTVSSWIEADAGSYCHRCRTMITLSSQLLSIHDFIFAFPFVLQKTRVLVYFCAKSW